MKGLILVFVVIAMSGCADSVTFEQAMNINPVGFWHGFWHGICLPFSWFGSLFNDDIALYAIYNNGGWYDFGFFMGAGGFSASIAFK